MKKLTFTILAILLVSVQVNASIHGYLESVCNSRNSISKHVSTHPFYRWQYVTLNEEEILDCKIIATGDNKSIALVQRSVLSNDDIQEQLILVNSRKNTSFYVYSKSSNVFRNFSSGRALGPDRGGNRLPDSFETIELVNTENISYYPKNPAAGLPSFFAITLKMTTSKDSYVTKATFGVNKCGGMNLLPLRNRNRYLKSCK